MDIIEVKLSDLKEYERNPRRNDKAVPYVRKSIEKFGFAVPLVIDKHNVIICGHTRFKALKAMGKQSAPCVRADDLTDEQAKAFRLVDNQTAELAAWDVVKLDEELEAIGLDMSEFGFTIGKVLEDSSEEINISDFDDDNFKYECPECGFRFND